jgi:transketolase
MEKLTGKQLAIMAAKARLLGLDAVHTAASGHIGGSLSIIDALTTLYFNVMNVDPADPKNPDRDRFVLSKGHCAPGLYAALAHRGFFPVEDLLSLRKVGSYLQGHPNMNSVPGVDMSTGSLGQGISTACGMALSAKLQNKAHRVYTLLGDGEIQEGQVWEAAMFASHYHLDDLCVIVDNNGLQIDGEVAKVMSPYPIDEKFRAFGFHVEVIDGHDFAAIDAAMNTAKTVKGQPCAIIMRTVKGKDVSFMENNAGWHGVAPNDAQYEQAMAELNQKLSELEGK